MVNAPQVIREFLTTPGTAFYQAIGERVYFPYLPPNCEKVAACIAFSFQGGMPEVGGVIVNPDVEIWCYGGGSSTAAWRDPNAAWTCYMALCDRLMTNGQALQRTFTPHGIILSAVQESEGVLINDPRIEWPGVQSVWSFEITART